MIDLSVLKSLRVIALNDADKQTYEAWYKSLCRWYSREFHTPLHVVMKDLSVEEIFRTYYDDIFWKLKTGDESAKEAFDNIVEDLLTEEHPDHKEAVQEAEVEDDKWYEEELKALEDKLSKSELKSGKAKAGQKPNLTSEPETIFVNADDPIPEDEGR